MSSRADSGLIHTLAEARAWADGRGVVLSRSSRASACCAPVSAGIPADAPELAVPGAWVVQAFVAGDELCSYAIASNGRLLSHMAYRPAYRLNRSSSYYFDPVEQPAIRDAVQRLVRGIGFSGQLSFDWIVDADGHPQALECNPRATSGLHLFAADSDLPGALLGDATNDACHEVSGGARMIAPLMLTAGLRDALRMRQLLKWRVDWARAGM